MNRNGHRVFPTLQDVVTTAHSDTLKTGSLKNP